MLPSFAGTMPCVTTPVTSPPATPLADWPAVRDTVVDVHGRQVRVLRADARDEHAVEPQLLVHGLGGSSVGWVQVMEGLTAHGPVAALDLPGFGRTPLTDDDQLTVQGCLELTLAVADVLGWERFTLHGNSLGGLLGVLLAAHHPTRVERLVLVSPALPPRWPLRLLVPSRAMLDGMVPLAVSSMTAAGLGALGLGGPELDERRNRALLKLIFHDPDVADPAVLGLMGADLAESDGAHRRRALLSLMWSIARSWSDPRRVWRAVHRVGVPTLVLGGTRDAIVPSGVLRTVLAARPDWEGHLLDDRRHVLMLEDPEGYLHLVERWRAGEHTA